ncbi:MAG: hypothetical protein LBD02_06250 [Christensenellaceae bacterium]|nr:hypothetical protein [Christensenellaceae bacterium]
MQLIIAGSMITIAATLSAVAFTLHSTLFPASSPASNVSSPPSTSIPVPFAFEGRSLNETRLNPSSMDFASVEFWDSSRVRFLTFEYRMPAYEAVSGLMNIKYAYIGAAHAKSAAAPEVHIEELPLSWAPFDPRAGFMVPISHEPTQAVPHYHYDYYIIALEDYAGEQCFDFLNVCWLCDSIGNDRNRYDWLAVYGEDWAETAHERQNQFALGFMTEFCVYKDGKPRPQYCSIGQESLDDFRKKAIAAFSSLENKLPAEELQKGATMVVGG